MDDRASLPLVLVAPSRRPWGRYVNSLEVFGREEYRMAKGYALAHVACAAPRDTARGAQAVKRHNNKGNCWATRIVYACRRCGNGELCDVCHTHEAPRGTCKKCPDCPACVEDMTRAPRPSTDKEGEHR
jgi:hypothetical protein